jgi:hypothetical protein
LDPKRTLESRNFESKVRYLVQAGDILWSDLKRCSFIEDFWGKGEHTSFIMVFKVDMAGRGGRGRGRGQGGRFEEDQWVGE